MLPFLSPPLALIHSPYIKVTKESSNNILRKALTIKAPDEEEGRNVLYCGCSLRLLARYRPITRKGVIWSIEKRNHITSTIQVFLPSCITLSALTHRLPVPLSLSPATQALKYRTTQRPTVETFWTPFWCSLVSISVAQYSPLSEYTFSIYKLQSVVFPLLMQYINSGAPTGYLSILPATQHFTGRIGLFVLQYSCLRWRRHCFSFSFLLHLLFMAAAAPKNYMHE